MSIRKQWEGVPQFVLAASIGTASIGHTLSEELLERRGIRWFDGSQQWKHNELFG